jgi:hypothetical protein
MIRKLDRFIHLPAPDRRDLVEAAALSTLAALLIRLFHFRRLAPRLGRHMAVSPEEQDESGREKAARVCRAIDVAARHLPWKPVCLPQAVAAQWMLRRRGISSTLYLGTDPAQAYHAHAWVRSGTTIVTGGPLEDRFTVVSSFA